ncbi:growth-regulated alpha protein-like isoform X2 [Thunnus maccoyii]|uniref:growth-regulated alpha protein-like isoform X2 n=1 Tax=Thunnus maccoyii TaxID=8240 RepID=UPI001C4D9FE4|nr:growth-regulated alpha protein-like isoform X2 [Thunnus maccoyii]
MKSAVIAFLTCLLVLYVQGQSDTASSCKCLNGYVGRVNTKVIQGMPVIHQSSVFCLKTEIIVTIADKKKCVNPASPLGKIILQNMSKQKKNEAVSMTTTTSQTNTQSSTSHHTTSTM